MDDIQGDPKAPKAGRLTPVDRARDLLPWRHAENLERCSLYWLPVSQFPAKGAQRDWLLAFFERISDKLTIDGTLRLELFVSIHTAMENSRQFQKDALNYGPLLGLSRSPGEPIKMPPDMAELERDTEAIIAGKKPRPTLREMTPDYTYWMLIKYPQEQREHYLGLGGMTMLFMKPDPKTVPPDEMEVPDLFYELNPSVEKKKVQAMVAAGFSLQDEFLAKSKKMFGEGLEDEPQWPGIVFIVPHLRSSHFFKESDDTVAQWFDLCDVYVNESPEDRGILLASKEDLTDTIIEIVRTMSEEGLTYPAV